MHYLYSDGSITGHPTLGGIGFVLLGDDRKEITRHSGAIGKATSNQAEYRALIAGLDAAIELNVQVLQCCTDSQLMARHINNQYRCRNSHLKMLLKQIRRRMLQIPHCTVGWIPRKLNSEADRLAKQGAWKNDGAGAANWIPAGWLRGLEEQKRNAGRIATKGLATIATQTAAKAPVEPMQAFERPGAVPSAPRRPAGLTEPQKRFIYALLAQLNVPFAQHEEYLADLTAVHIPINELSKAEASVVIGILKRTANDMRVVR